MNVTTKLYEAIAAVAPIDGVAIGDPTDKQTWRIDFKDEATAQEQTDGQAALDAFDLSAEQTKLDNVEKFKQKAALQQAKDAATTDGDTDAATALQAEIDALA